MTQVASWRKRKGQRQDLVSQHHAERLWRKWRWKSLLPFSHLSHKTSPSFPVVPFLFYFILFFPSSMPAAASLQESCRQELPLLCSPDWFLERWYIPCTESAVTFRGRVCDCVIIHILIQFLVHQNGLQRLLGVTHFATVLPIIFEYLFFSSHSHFVSAKRSGRSWQISTWDASTTLW